MRIETVRKKLKALDTESREQLAERAKVGVATIHRIANVPRYLPSMRTWEKLVGALK